MNKSMKRTSVVQPLHFTCQALRRKEACSRPKVLEISDLFNKIKQEKNNKSTRSPNSQCAPSYSTWPLTLYFKERMKNYVREGRKTKGLMVYLQSLMHTVSLSIALGGPKKNESLGEEQYSLTQYSCENGKKRKVARWE